jgi:hypothetical protein
MYHLYRLFFALRAKNNPQKKKKYHVRKHTQSPDPAADLVRVTERAG